FHFFPNQPAPVALIQSIQQSLDPLPGLQPLADVRVLFTLLRRAEHLPSLLFAQVRFVHQRPDLPLSQHVPAFIHRNLVKPGAECRALAKALQREIRFHEDLLRDIFDVLAPPHNPTGYRKYPMLVPPDQFLKGLLVLALRPPHQLPVVGSFDRMNSTTPPSLRRDGCVQGLCFWDVCHRFLVTPLSPDCLALHPCFVWPLESLYLLLFLLL